MNFYDIPPITALVNLSIVCAPLIIFVWVLLYKKGFAVIRLWAVSWFLIFTVLGTALQLFTNNIWYQVISALMAVLGSIGVLLLPKSQPAFVRKLKLKF